MRFLIRIGQFFAVGATLLILDPARTDAQAQAFVESVKVNCARELKTYCARVKPGEGRLAFCLLAYEDKLSSKCDQSLFYAASELAKIVSARADVVTVCRPDALRLCANVKPGEGNILF